MSATFNVFLGGSNYAASFAALDETVQLPTATSFYLQEGNFMLSFQGNFTLNQWGVITGGTITGFKGFVNGTQVLNAYGYQMDYQAFAVARMNIPSNPEPMMIDLIYPPGVAINGSVYGDDLVGGKNGEFFSGFAGDDEIFGRGGDDFAMGGGGKDLMEGGDGIDTVSYSDHVDPVSVDLTQDDSLGGVVLVSVGGIVEDTIKGFENVIGGSGNDELTGDGLSNILFGAAGDDKIFGNDGNDMLGGGSGRDKLDGGKGNDRLAGYEGNDVLKGGKNSDSFLFATALDKHDNVDKVKDFKPGVDTIELFGMVFASLPAGDLKGKYFHAGKKAADGNDHIIYDNGKLFYDADGKGGAKQVAFAVLKGAPEIDAHDFLVI